MTNGSFAAETSVPSDRDGVARTECVASAQPLLVLTCHAGEVERAAYVRTREDLSAFNHSEKGLLLPRIREGVEVEVEAHLKMKRVLAGTINSVRRRPCALSPPARRER